MSTLTLQGKWDFERKTVIKGIFAYFIFCLSKRLKNLHQNLHLGEHVITVTFHFKIHRCLITMLNPSGKGIYLCVLPFVGTRQLQLSSCTCNQTGKSKPGKSRKKRAELSDKLATCSQGPKDQNRCQINLFQG